MSSTHPVQNTQTTAQKPPKIVHGSGFTMIRPDTSKNNRLKEVAEKEEQSYHQYKDTKRHGYHTTNGTVGSSSGSVRPRGTASSTGNAPPRTTRSTSNSSSLSKQATTYKPLSTVKTPSTYKPLSTAKTPSTIKPSSTTTSRTGASVIQRTAATNARMAQYNDNPLAIEKHKLEQRRKGEDNRRLEEERQARLDRSRRQQNSKFLDRLERK